MCKCISNKTKIRKKSKAFTLLEMLVVIAIIGILATLIIFSLAGTRQKSAAAKAKADMAQLRSALEKASGADGCLAMTFVNSGNGAVLRCTTTNTDYATAQAPAFGAYSLTVNGCSVSSNSSSTWGTPSGCGTGVAPTSYSFQASGLSGGATYTCSMAGCVCSSGTCDTF